MFHHCSWRMEFSVSYDKGFYLFFSIPSEAFPPGLFFYKLTYLLYKKWVLHRNFYLITMAICYLNNKPLLLKGFSCSRVSTHNTYRLLPAQYHSWQLSLIFYVLSDSIVYCFALTCYRHIQLYAVHVLYHCYVVQVGK